ncbi:uncharacterized protein LOC123717182 isoform X3 [Pieris brassicae]|uniref:uncharacterized protein LOC123717182 isoform X3 n=1 Tax=Pieris brassicae TaxID=7116 RepID=UPI001E65F3B0|nr:uncharacterized protein LOC123717182 isoform X3 [Pieris brassicae]
MATAAICLKFTSLTRNRSKCCLEIVPEVTNIQNIDQIKWRESTDSIEYLVPITYKLVLKKHNTLKNNDAVRFYHSCIDLVPSWSHEDLAYGDVSKNISDHLIHRIYNKINTCVSLSRPNALNIINENPKDLEVLETKLDNILHNIHVKRDFGTCISESQFEYSKKERNSTLEVNNKTTIGTLTDVLPQLSSNEKKTLTIVPVCKIDTFEDIINKYPSRVLDLPQSIVRYNPLTKRNPKGETKFVRQPPQCNISLDCSLNSFVNLNARVSYFKSVMEKEILPLKIILQDIITKCSTFGLLHNSNYSKNKCINDKIALENKNRCNRVVYSIVFDE